jgi:hypothetical protein
VTCGRKGVLHGSILAGMKKYHPAENE